MMPRVNMAVALTRVSGTSLLRYSRWALAITAGCLPLYVVRYQAGPVPTTVLENLVLLTIALYVVGRIQAGTWVWPRSGLEIPTAALLVAGAIAWWINMVVFVAYTVCFIVLLRKMIEREDFGTGPLPDPLSKAERSQPDSVGARQ